MDPVETTRQNGFAEMTDRSFSADQRPYIQTSRPLDELEYGPGRLRQAVLEMNDRLGRVDAQA